jgi:hypothetical protein
MKSSIATPWLSTQSDFSTSCHGKIRVRQCSTSFGFQIHACNPLPHPTLVFALSQVVEPGGKSVQFAVRVDLESGEIWDIANSTGVIGWLDRELWPSVTEEYPLVLRWEVEHTGSALIPRLLIGEEEWLYPSVLFPGEATFSAVTGHNLAGATMRDVFSPGYVWCQDRLG